MRKLIDDLYSDKIATPIRELWTNAFDSHIMAGCAAKSFRCQLPNAKTPTFMVRDYGVSLTHEQVMVLYTTVFRSTKERTNAQVGQLGLGSKSPFCYTDAFSVVAYMDGEVEAKRAKGYTQEQALGFVREHLDTYEKQQRDKKPKLVARLKAAAASGLSGKGDSEPQATQPINKPRAELPRDRFTIDAPATGEPPPAALHKEQGRPKTRARA